MKRAGKGLHQHFFTEARHPLVVYEGDKLFAHVWLDPKDTPKTIQLQFHSAGSWEHRAYWGENLGHARERPDGPANKKIGNLPETGKWVRLEVAATDVGLAPGAKIDGWAFTQFEGTAYYDQAGVHTLLPPDDSYLRSLAAWELREKDNPKLPEDLRAILKLEPDKRAEGQKRMLRDYYLRHVCLATRTLVDPMHAEIADLDARIKKLDAEIPTCMISEEMDKPRPAYVLIRGDFLQRGEEVSRDTPAIFPPFPADQPRNRLGLARWLVAPDHPLTARVTVNRFWHQLFGTGLVKSLGDFGTQGDLPSHPELLDYLATDFVASGWNIKATLKKIAMSATYRQASAVRADAAQVDPYNRLLARSPRFRLNAEEVRDNALSIAGLLSAKVGGPSVMPYQPPDYYKGKNENWPWKPSEGEDQYRRGIYTFWRRTTLHPMMAVFDAPSREECTACRPRTNTPLQALVTLNDPTFVEAARVFAQKILTEGPADRDGRLVFAFRSALARKPSEAELAYLVKRYDQLKARFDGDKEAADKLVKVGTYPRPDKLDIAEHAAFTALANILLNLDETITRE
jgi:hypothetical protein